MILDVIKSEKDIKKAIIAFLIKHTSHQAKTATIKKGRKCDYSCTVLNSEGKLVQVAFWVGNEVLSYGIVGWGISSSVSFKSLENE